MWLIIHGPISVKNVTKSKYHHWPLLSNKTDVIYTPLHMENDKMYDTLSLRANLYKMHQIISTVHNCPVFFQVSLQLWLEQNITFLSCFLKNTLYCSEIWFTSFKVEQQRPIQSLCSVMYQSSVKFTDFTNIALALYMWYNRVFARISKSKNGFN